MLLGEKIEKAVRSTGRPVDEIAKEIGMSDVNLYRLFKRESVETKYLEKLCKTLNIPMKYFFEENWDALIRTEESVIVAEVKASKEVDDSFWKDQIKLKDQLLLEERERLKKCEQELTRIKNDRDGFYDQKLAH